MNPKYVTSLELSKQLKEAGILQESEWYWVCVKARSEKEWGEPQLLPRVVSSNGTEEYLLIASAFHVGELGEMLQYIAYRNNGNIRATRYTLQIRKWEKQWIVSYKSMSNEILNEEEADTEAEARGKMLLYLRENNLI